MKKILFALFINFMGILFANAANDIPPANGYMHDFAGKLSQEQVDSMNSMLKMYFLRTKAKIAVVIEQDSDDEPFDRSLNFARTWRVGTKDSNNGLVFYINVNKRKAFIQVANKRQGKLNDGKVGEILRSYWVPSAKEDQYYQGIYRTVFALMCEIEGKNPPPIDMTVKINQNTVSSDWEIPFIVLLILLIVIAVQIYSLKFDIKCAQKLTMVEKGDLII